MICRRCGEEAFIEEAKPGKYEAWCETCNDYAKGADANDEVRERFIAQCELRDYSEDI